MSATFQLYRDYGESLHSSSNTNWVVNLLNVDSVNCISTNYPIARPDDGTIKTSYEAWTYFYMTKAPQTRCENFKFWGPSDNVAQGVTLWCSAIPRASGQTPSLTSLICVTSARPHNTPGTSVLLNGNCSGVGSPSGYLVLQLRVDSSANIGQITGDTMVMHISYDES